MIDPSVVSDAPTLVALLSRTAPASPPADLGDRAEGVMFGLAVGNLLGLEVEGEWYNDIADRYPLGLTDINPAEAHRPMDDDLAQAVALAESLLAGGYYVQDFADRLIAWKRDNARGMGITTGEVIRELERGAPLPGPARAIYERRNGIAPNGGVMRCGAPRWLSPDGWTPGCW